MPADNGFRRNDDDRVHNRGEQTIEANEDKPVDVSQPHPSGLAAQNDHLLAQGNVFGREPRLRFQSQAEDEQQPGQERSHGALHYHTTGSLVTPDEILTRHNAYKATLAARMIQIVLFRQQ